MSSLPIAKSPTSTERSTRFEAILVSSISLVIPRRLQRMETRHSTSGGGLALLRMCRRYAGIYKDADQCSSSETTDARGDQHIMMHFYVCQSVARSILIANNLRLMDQRTTALPDFIWSSTVGIATSYISTCLSMSEAMKGSTWNMKTHQPRTARN